MATQITKGVTLSVDKLGTGAAHTKILQITAIDGPSGSTDSLEITDYDSAVREFRSGLHDPGEATFEFNLDPANTEHKWLMGRPESGETYSWRISIPTTPKKTLIDFDGFVTSAPPSFGAPGEVITGSTAIKITGPVVWSEETE